MRHEGGAYLGRYPQGRRLALRVQCHDAARAPARPDAAPVADIWGDSGIVATIRLPADDLGGVVGLFRGSILLGPDFPLGRYRVAYRYRAGGYFGVVVDYFEVVGGGDRAGDVISLYSYQRPEATYVLAQVRGGRILYGRNPRL